MERADPACATRSSRRTWPKSSTRDSIRRRDTRVEIGAYGLIVKPDRRVRLGRAGILSRKDRPPDASATIRPKAVSRKCSRCRQRAWAWTRLPATPASCRAGSTSIKKGVMWTALSGSNHLASFDRRKCAGHAERASGAPGPALQGRMDAPCRCRAPRSRARTCVSDYYYYNWVDQFNTLGLGENVPIATGTGSDSLIALAARRRISRS